MNRFWDIAVTNARAQGQEIQREQVFRRSNEFLQMVDDFVAGRITEAELWSHAGDLIDAAREVRGEA